MAVFYGTEVASPLMLGTAQYPSPAILAEAFRASGAGVATVSLRREAEAHGDLRGFEAALRAKVFADLASSPHDEPPARLAVIGMGRYGGGELGYSSDADVIFVHRPREGADASAAQDQALAVVTELRRLAALAGPDPKLEIDADLSWALLVSLAAGGVVSTADIDAALATCAALSAA